MSNDTGKAMLPFKAQQLLEMIMKKKKMNYTDALFYLYSSNLYKELPDENAKFWYLSTPALYEMLEEEKLKERGKENIASNLALFFTFCVEAYKEESSHSAEEIVGIFKAEGVFDFLRDNFEILHTQGQGYIAEEIVLFLNK